MCFFPKKPIFDPLNRFENFDFLHLFYNFCHLGPLDPYKPPFNPINRPRDLSSSIDLVEIYILVDLELHSAYLMPIHAKTRGPQGRPHG